MKLCSVLVKETHTSFYFQHTLFYRAQDALCYVEKIALDFWHIFVTIGLYFLKIHVFHSSLHYFQSHSY